MKKPRTANPSPAFAAFSMFKYFVLLWTMWSSPKELNPFNKCSDPLDPELPQRM